MTIGIYKLEFAGTSKVYIGQSVNIETRFKQHLNLMRKQESSVKLNEAYKTYGNPTLEVLSECTEEELDSFEKETIEIFNSVVSGFNTCISTGGKTSLSGENHPNSNYSNESIHLVLKLLVSNLELNFQDIYELTGVSRSVIAGVSCLQQHKWLESIYPKEYKELQLQFTNGIRLNCTKRGTKSDEYQLVSPEGVVHKIVNTRQFAELHGLDHTHVSKLRKGVRKSHKGWKLYSS